MPQYACLYGTGFLTMWQLTVDADPLPEESTDDLDISHVTVWSISNWRFTLPITIATFGNTEDTTALVDCGAKGLFINDTIAHKWRRSILPKLIKVRNIGVQWRIPEEAWMQLVMLEEHMWRSIFNLKASCNHTFPGHIPIATRVTCDQEEKHSSLTHNQRWLTTGMRLLCQWDI